MRRSRAATPTSARPTNRGERSVQSTNNPCSRIYQPDDYGIDKLRLGFPIWEPVFKSSRWALTTHDGPNGPVVTSGRLKLIHRSHTFQINVYRCYWGWECSVEFNPARIVDPNGYAFCHPDDLIDVTDEVVEVVVRHVRPRLPTDCSVVKRVDVARNFSGVEQPERYLLGLRHVPRPYATREGLWSGSGVPETLWAGTKSGDMFKLYDKHRKSPHLAPPGTLRWEVQAKKSWLKRCGGISRVEDLTPENIDTLVDDRIKWSGLECEVMTVESAVDKILQIEGINATTKVGLLEYASAVRRGVDPRTCAKPSVVGRYRRILKDQRIAPYLDVDFDRS